MNKKSIIIFFLVFFISLILDQFSKTLVLEIIKDGEVKITKYFSLIFVGNKGVLFGLFSNLPMNIPIIIISFFVILILCIYAINSSKESKILHLFLGLVAGGIGGNLLDRIKYGYVIDFLDFKIWPVFNLSDVFIVSGTILTILYYIKRKKCIPNS
ncbi:MAG TPA: signal peptidase II [Candidatus Ratteibacteria bacterium]|nr:signal peptidase II [bacterium]HRR96436.1 signal peptidase II [Candidatus Ratteibacteria bacterium]